LGKLSSKLNVAQVSLSNLPMQTKMMTDSVVGVTGESVSLGNSEFQCFRDSNGVYSLYINFDGSVGSSSSHTLTLDLGGTTFSGNQALSESTLSTRIARAVSGTNTMILSGATTTGVRPNGTVVLAGKPSWFDANREDGVTVLAQIGSGTTTTEGLVYKPDADSVNITSGDINTTSATFVDVTGTTLTVTLAVAGRIAYATSFTQMQSGTTSTSAHYFNIRIDGTTNMYGSEGLQLQNDTAINDERVVTMAVTIVWSREPCS